MAADNADVRSVEQLENFLEDTKRYRAHLIKEVEGLEVEIRKISFWIENEAPNYWQQELRKAQHKFTEAQEALTRCMSYVREEERRPCTEQKKLVKVTKERRALCEEKLQTARSAMKAWDRDYRKNQGKFQRVRDLAETDLVVAAAHLTTQLNTLIEYAGLRSAGLKSLTSDSKSSDKSGADASESDSAEPSGSSASEPESAGGKP
ncbi:MAG: hypothetical protein AAF483_12985 [Planctomycetota bacterium]